MKTTRNLWPYGIIIAFVVFLSGTASLIVIAATHPQSLVSGNYYEQEIKYQGRIDGAARAKQAGATVSFDPTTKQMVISLSAAQAGRDRAHLDTAPTPSPRLSGERAGVRGFDSGDNGLLTPTLSSFGEEREKNEGSTRMYPRNLSGQIELYRPSAAGLDRQYQLQPDTEGRQSIDLAALPEGPWEIRVSWNAGGQDYFLDRKIVITAKNQQ